MADARAAAPERVLTADARVLLTARSAKPSILPSVITRRQ